MKIKIGWKRFKFDPESIDWKHQSSPNAQFGFIDRPAVFVKRFKSQPTGWDLLTRLHNQSHPHLNRTLHLAEDGPYYYAFNEHLQGDTLWNILRDGRTGDYFQSAELSDADRFHLFAAVYRAFRKIHPSGFWYPDLDLKNVFVHREGNETRVCLIDLDSAAPLDRPYHPDQVSQRYWEGLVRTRHDAGSPFLRATGNGERQVVADGRALNQSMLILWAYEMRRLGKIPPGAPLYAPLIDARNPHHEFVRELHRKLAQGPLAWNTLSIYFSRYFAMDQRAFQQRVQESSFPLRVWDAMRTRFKPSLDGPKDKPAAPQAARETRPSTTGTG